MAQRPYARARSGVPVRALHGSARTVSDERARSLGFPAVPASAGAARRFVTDALREWDLEPLAYDAATVVSELATNAIVHACDQSNPSEEFRVTVTADSIEVMITVTDLAEDEPSELFPGEPQAAAESGRGLGIVAAYSDDWGWRRQDGAGKVVWATLVIERFLCPDKEDGSGSAR